MTTLFRFAACLLFAAVFGAAAIAIGDGSALNTPNSTGFPMCCVSSN
jgi:hypothetical protein